MGSTTRMTVDLTPSQTLSLDGVRDFTVRCASGSVWVSPGNGQDVALSQGMRQRVGTVGKVVIQGLADARIELRWRA